MGMEMYAWSLKPKKLAGKDPILKLAKGIYEDYSDITTFAMRAGKATFNELVDQLFEMEQIFTWKNRYRLDLWMCMHFASSLKDKAFETFGCNGTSWIDGGEDLQKLLVLMSVGFNQQPVMLSGDDIQTLENAIALESTCEVPPDIQGDSFKIEDFQFTKVARSELSKGRILYYDNCW